MVCLVAYDQNKALNARLSYFRMTVGSGFEAAIFKTLVDRFWQKQTLGPKSETAHCRFLSFGHSPISR